MKYGLEINEFDWSGGPASIGRHLAEIGRRAEAAGFHSVWVWDHFIQLRRWIFIVLPRIADSDSIERFGAEVIAANG